MTNQNKILIVDDEKEILRSFSLWIENEGFTVYTADSGDKAIDLVDLCRVMVFKHNCKDVSYPPGVGKNCTVKTGKIGRSQRSRILHNPAIHIFNCQEH